jgi:teichuronic acid biosynthesis glycosyltransferase TuaG
MINKKANNCLVSIVTPTYNSELFISELISCIQNQTFQGWELLITDDCSTDNTVELVRKFIQTDGRIKLFQLSKNSGAGVARNNSIKEASGRFIAFCDSDDRWLPNKLEVQLQFLTNHKTAFTYSSYLTKDENFKETGRVNAPEEISYKEILRNNYIGCLTAIYDTKTLGKMFMPDIRKRQDWVLWINIIKRLGVVQGIPEPLATYTIRKNSISSNKFNLVKYNWIVYNKALGFGMIRSLLYLIQFLYFYARKKINF